MAKFINLTSSYCFDDFVIQPWQIKEKLELALTSLKEQVKAIRLLKSQNTKLISHTSNQEDICYLFIIREGYDDLIDRLQEGIDSASFILKFIHLCDGYSVQLEYIKSNVRSFNETIQEKSEKYHRDFRKLLNLEIVNASCEELTDKLIFAIFILDDFHLNKEIYENNLWNVAIRNTMEECYIYLPDELLEIKWGCNRLKDDISEIKEPLNEYCLRNANDQKLIINLCYISYKFYECFNYKSSSYLLNLAMAILKETKTDTKEKYYQFSLCKGLLSMKFRDYDVGLKILMDGVKYLTNKFGIDIEHDLLISAEFLSIGSILVNNEFNDLGIIVLETSLKCLEQYLPLSYDLWIETVDVLGRSYNDLFDFTQSLITVAPTFDYFHILNFGAIKTDNKPVYEIAIEISSKGRFLKFTRQLKYPGYLPRAMTMLLNEMMISFSGLGDQTGILIMQNWIDKCVLVSKNLKRSVIESSSYFGEIDIERVIKKMKKNKSRHEALFKHLIVADIEDSMMSTAMS